MTSQPVITPLSAPTTSETSDLKLDDFDPSYNSQLFKHVSSSRDELQDLCLLGFDTLQRINVAHIQNELAKLKANIFEQQRILPDQRKALRLLLCEYAIAARDYEYFQKLRPMDEEKGMERQASLIDSFPEISKLGDPYNTEFSEFSNEFSSEHDALRNFLRKSLPSYITWTEEERRQRKDDFYGKKAPNCISPRVERLARFTVALLGGSTLIVPMLIMSIHRSHTKSLITTSVATILFSAFLSFGLRTSDRETLVATATYAAVLVVFVGTSTTSG